MNFGNVGTFVRLNIPAHDPKEFIDDVFGVTSRGGAPIAQVVMNCCALGTEEAGYFSVGVGVGVGVGFRGRRAWHAMSCLVMKVFGLSH